MNITPELLTAMAGIPLGSIAIYLMYKLSSNHIEHNTAAIEKLAGAVDSNTKASLAFFAWLKGVMLADQDEENDA